jgi:hypothetical protein
MWQICDIIKCLYRYSTCQRYSGRIIPVDPVTKEAVVFFDHFTIPCDSLLTLYAGKNSGSIFYAY